MTKLVQSIRKRPRPILVEFKTFRMRGHEEASGTKYVPKALMETWAKKDPLVNFQSYLKSEQILTEENEVKMKEEIMKEIHDNLEIAFNEEAITPDLTTELSDVYKAFNYEEVKPSENAKELRHVDAISEGLRQSMQKHDDLVIMGQDIAEYGGVFKITEGFVEEFGKERVRNTPSCESAFVEAGMGRSIAG
jgi:2-oxoisovalerate dehydrogenase E1 component